MYSTFSVRIAFSKLVPFTITASILMDKAENRQKTCREGQKRASFPCPITADGVGVLTESSRIDVVDPKLGASSPTLVGSRPLKSTRTWRTLIGLPGTMERACSPEPRKVESRGRIVGVTTRGGDMGM